MKKFKTILENVLNELVGDVTKYKPAAAAPKKGPKIKVKHPGLLKVPEGKSFDELPISHYEKLVKSKGYAKIIRGLVNLRIWNKNKHPDISRKAKTIEDQLRKKFRGE